MAFWGQEFDDGYEFRVSQFFRDEGRSDGWGFWGNFLRV